MGYRLREFEAERKFSSELTLEAIGQAVSMGEIKAVLQEGEGVDAGHAAPVTIWVFHRSFG